MALTLKTIIVFGSVLLTGLSAGLFYAWTVSVIPGTQKITDAAYLETMQSINRAILNPAFFVVFFGSIICLSIGSTYAFNTSTTTFWLMLAASVCYLVGTVGVTGLGNVPLNNQLDALDLPQLTTQKRTVFRQYYETNWNRLHQIRTTFAIVAFVLALLGLFTHTK